MHFCLILCDLASCCQEYFSFRVVKKTIHYLFYLYYLYSMFKEVKALSKDNVLSKDRFYII